MFENEFGKSFDRRSFLRGSALFRVLGEGAFGTVYRSTQPGIGRDVAVKTARYMEYRGPNWLPAGFSYGAN